MHVLLDQLIKYHWVSLCRNHVADCFVERVHLMRLQVADDRVDVVNDLLDEGHVLAKLNRDKVAATLLSDLDERVARHVLNSLVGLVHEFEQLVHYGLQELPVRTKKARVLADHVHNVGSNDSLVVFASFLFAQAKKILFSSN